MAELPACPDHPNSTMLGILGDYYCLDCDWWDFPEVDENAI